MSVSHRYSPTLILSGLICLVSACGGGSSGGNTPTTPSQPVNQSPTPSFVLSATSGVAPMTVSVNAQAANDADGEITSFIWDFAGTDAIGVVAQHVFPDAGTFTVQLTVTDNDGASASSSQVVTVTPPASNVTLSGTVNILGSSAVDSDLNDRLTITQSNNSFGSAQVLPSTFTLGGFANVANSGEPTGNLFSSGDPGDFFQVSLLGGELILLDIAEASADLDVRLWDESFNLVDSSLGISNTESLEVTAAGTYYIEVVPFSGASNYVLSVGQASQNNQLQNTVLTSRMPTRLTDPFIPGQLIIKPKINHQTLNFAQLQLNPIPKQTEAQHQRRLTRVHAEPNIDASHLAELYQVNTPAPVPANQAPETQLNIPVGSKVTPKQILRMQTLHALKLLAADQRIEYAEPNVLATTHATPNDELYSSQWHYPAIHLPTAWDTTTGSADVIVAVIDTGVLLNHPDFNGQLVEGFDFISDAQRALDGDGIDNNPNDPGDRELGGSSSFHGTHVAATVAARANNTQGVAGVAWQSRIMPLRVLGDGGGSTFDIVQAVRYAAGLSNSSGTVPNQRADIINLSLGGTFSSQTEQDTYIEARNAGVIIVASAGNEATALPAYPAAYEGVTSVSATTISGTLAPYSNTGASIDVAAPGGTNLTDLNGDGISDGVISAMGDDSGSNIEFGYAALSGTSMAAPHVAGVAALMKAVHPGLTPSEFELALVAGELTDDRGSPGRDDLYGHGLINAQKAVFAAQSMANGTSIDPGPILVSSASTLNFGSFLTSLELSIQNIGTGSPTVTSVTADEPWLSITPPNTGDGLGVYNIELDRNTLADGAYTSTITVQSDANNLNITIIMQVSSINHNADAGLHYVILVNTDGDTVLPSQLVTATNGAYPFTINNVPPGSYRLFAGSDYDDDSLLCDGGEACGAYPTLDSPAFLAVNEDRAGLNFDSGFRINLSISQAAQNKQDGGVAITPLSIHKPSTTPSGVTNE